MEVDSLKHKNERFRQELQASQKERVAEALDLRKQIEGLQRELGSARQHEAEVTNYCERQKQELHAIKDELRRAEVQHEITRRQLQEKASELQSAQLFTDQADSFSGADVIALVNALNAEILQGAAVIAESLQDTPRQQTPPTLDKRLFEKIQGLIGEDLTQALLFQRADDRQNADPTLVQLALQACLVDCCAYIGRAWVLGGDERILKEVYARIFEKG